MFVFEITISGNYVYYDCSKEEAIHYIKTYSYMEDRIFMISNTCGIISIAMAELLTRNFDRFKHYKLISVIGFS